MGLFRKKATTADAMEMVRVVGLLTEVDSASVELPDRVEKVTASEALGLLWPHIEAWGADARLFLILSDAVHADGRSDEWQFHALFPSRRAEGIWRLHTSDEATELVGSYRVAPVPEPGTAEYLMAQISPQIFANQNVAWETRLEMIRPLPLEFHDSSEAALQFQSIEPNPFHSGPIRLKARRGQNGRASSPAAPPGRAENGRYRER